MLPASKSESRSSAAREPAPSIMVVAGEASGDEHAAGLVRAIKEARPNARIFGMGGSALRKAGMEITVDSEVAASVMGLTEVIGSWKTIRSAYRDLVAVAAQRRPDAVVLVDFPDFNLFLARSLSRRGMRIVYFISPQLWAWRRRRVKTIKKYIAKVLPIFPFEESFYQQHGVTAQYIGHPFLDRPPVTADRDRFLTEIGIDPARPVIALLPGSRKAELERLLPPMAEAYRRLLAGRPGLQAVLPVASTLDPGVVEEMLRAYPGIKVVKGQAREALTFATAAVIASGTATVEAALCEVPFVVVYRLSRFTHRIARLLVRGVRFMAMANLIAGRKVVEELLQDDASPERIAEELERLLGDEKKRETMRAELAIVRKRLARGLETSKTCGQRAAEAVLKMTEPVTGKKAVRRVNV